MHIDDKQFDAIKHYLSSLSSLVAGHLKKNMDGSHKAFDFNIEYFTRIFKRYTGQTPRRIRRGLAGGYFRYTISVEEK